MSKRILSVSYDVSLLETRKMLLEQKGYSVVNSHGFGQKLLRLAVTRQSGFELFVLYILRALHSHTMTNWH